MLCLAHVSYAQSPAFLFKTYSIPQGLSSSTVYAIHQDSRGFIWIGTSEGLNRFDGVEFQGFAAGKPTEHGLSGDMITSIAEDAEGNLWLGVWYGGLGYYHRATGQFKTFRPNPDFPINSEPNSVWTVSIDDAGFIWAGTQRNGLYRFDPKTKKFRAFRYSATDPNSLSSDAITAILPDGPQLWVATADGGLNLLNRNTLQVAARYTATPENGGLVSNALNTLLLDRNGVLWIGSKDNGISALQPDRRTFRNFTPSSAPGALHAANIRQFLEDDTGRIWIGSDGSGLQFFNRKTNTFTQLLSQSTSTESLRSNVIFALTKSTDGLIWIGTFKGGLQVYDRNKFQFYLSEPFLDPALLSYKVVLSVLEDSKHRLWVGTDGGGLNLYVPSEKRFQPLPAGPAAAGFLQGRAIKTLYEDRFGNIWAGTYGDGLNLLPAGSTKWKNFRHDPSVPGSLSHNHAWDIAEDPEGTLWVATLGGGLNKLDRSTMQFERVASQQGAFGLPSDQVYSIYPDRSRNRLWIGTAQGLFYYDLYSKRIKLAISQEDYSGVEVKCVYVDRKNRVWFSARKKGLLLLHPESGRLTVYGQAQGLLSNTVASILEDAQGYLWISTNRGICRLHPGTGSLLNFTTADGLRNTEYLTESAFALQNGSLLFGGSEGLDLIKPKQIQEEVPPVRVAITNVWVLNKPVQPIFPEKNSTASKTPEIQLRHFENSVTIAFSALNFSAPEKIKYAYRLDGVERTWNYIDNRRLITLTNLSPGSYTLHVKATNQAGVWQDEQGTTLQITVLPPWWKTWWFRLLLFLGIGGALYIGVWLRNVRLQKSTYSGSMVVHTYPDQRLNEKVGEAPHNETLLQSQPEHQAQNNQIPSITPSQQASISPLDTEFLQKAQGMVEANLDNPAFSVGSFVREMGMSRTLIHLKLKELTNHSTGDFIRSIRLNHAAQLLLSGKYTVSEIAYLVGFNDPKYFNKCFKEKYGVTPGTYAEKSVHERQ